MRNFSSLQDDGAHPNVVVAMNVKKGICHDQKKSGSNWTSSAILKVAPFLRGLLHARLGFVAKKSSYLMLLQFTILEASQMLLIVKVCVLGFALHVSLLWLDDALVNLYSAHISSVASAQYFSL